MSGAGPPWVKNDCQSGIGFGRPGAALGLSARYFTDPDFFFAGWATLAFGLVGALAFGLKVGTNANLSKAIFSPAGSFPGGIARGLASGRNPQPGGWAGPFFCPLA